VPAVGRWLPAELRIREIAEGEHLRGFRIVKVATPDDPDLPLSFRSHHAEGLEPRRQQTQHAALHTAISCWRSGESAARLAKRFPKLGSYVAVVDLEAGHGFNYLNPEDEIDPEHLTIWGDSAALAAAVADIVPVDF
jgi:hypothetical protein